MQDIKISLIFLGKEIPHNQLFILEYKMYTNSSKPCISIGPLIYPIFNLDLQVHLFFLLIVFFLHICRHNK